MIYTTASSICLFLSGLPHSREGSMGQTHFLPQLKTYHHSRIRTDSKFELKNHKHTNELFAGGVPEFITSPVLQQVYPSLIKHIKQYGNPNIPLGSIDGRNCKTIRRLAFEKKLTEQEMELLKEMNFRFNNFEDVYEEADFNDCFERLLKYEEQNKNRFQIPKKYPQDPELGAWVTMIRRLGRDNIEVERRIKLDEIGFVWVSSRKCGSSFMKNYRPIKEKLEACARMNQESGKWEVVNKEGIQTIMQEEQTRKWLKAQSDAAKVGNLAQARCDFLDQLPGVDWRVIS
jgi:hypothetical protein